MPGGDTIISISTETLLSCHGVRLLYSRDHPRFKTGIVPASLLISKYLFHMPLGSASSPTLFPCVKQPVSKAKELPSTGLEPARLTYGIATTYTEGVEPSVSGRGQSNPVTYSIATYVAVHSNLTAIRLT
jgi:hypothetical protein